MLRASSAARLPGSCTSGSKPWILNPTLGNKKYEKNPPQQKGITCCWTARELSRVHSSMRPTRSVLLTPSVRLICAEA